MPPRERLGYAGIIGLLLFAAGYIGAQKLRRPAQIVFETPLAQAPSKAHVEPSVKAVSQPNNRPAAFQNRSGKVLAALGSVSINRADAAEFQTLPGVGPATAEKILAFRKQNGEFRSIDELRHVKGIGEKKLAAMRKYLKL